MGLQVHFYEHMLQVVQYQLQMIFIKWFLKNSENKLLVKFVDKVISQTSGCELTITIHVII